MHCWALSRCALIIGHLLRQRLRVKGWGEQWHKALGRAFTHLRIIHCVDTRKDLWIRETVSAGWTADRATWTSQELILHPGQCQMYWLLHNNGFSHDCFMYFLPPSVLWHTPPTWASEAWEINVLLMMMKMVTCVRSIVTWVDSGQGDTEQFKWTASFGRSLPK